MSEWMYWLALAGAVLIMEMFSGTFYLLMIAVGLAFGGAASMLGMSVPVQILVAAAVGVVATGILRRSRLGSPLKLDAARDPNVNIDIGQPVTVDSWHEGKARIMYRGALWDVELAPGTMAAAGNFTIVEIQGSRLIVTRS